MLYHATLSMVLYLDLDVAVVCLQDELVVKLQSQSVSEHPWRKFERIGSSTGRRNGMNSPELHLLNMWLLDWIH